MKYFMRLLGLFFIILLAACGGGGGSTGANPNQPTLTSTAGDVLTIPAGAFRQYALSGGVPPYQATSSEPAIAVGNVIGNSLSIGAIAGGKAIVRVFDFRGTIVATEVTVGSSIPLHTTAPSPFKLRPSGSTVTCTGSLSTGAERAVYAISGGSPPYRVVSSNTEVLAVTLTDASHWEAVATSTRGEATVRIADAAGASLSIDFSNISTAVPASLRLASEALTLPVGYEAEVIAAGGVPPYRPATGIPAAIQVTPSCSEDGKFRIMGILASELDIGFVDYVGQTAKVKVTVNTATVSFRLSPSPMRISENGSESITLSLFGFYGDTGTDAASGDVCIYVSDPSYFALDPARTQCSKFSPATRTFTLNAGSRGNRCVSANKDIQIRAVDSKQQIADGVITIMDNGTGCNTTGQLRLSPGSVAIDSGKKVDVLIQGGTGSYVATSANGTIVAAVVSGDVLSVVGGTSGGQTTVLVTDVGSGQSATLAVTSGTPIGSISVVPSSVTVSKGTSTAVQVLGGSGTFTTSSANSAIATAAVAGSTVTITGGATGGITSVLVIDAVTGSTAAVSVTNGSAAGALTVTPGSLIVSPGTSASVTVSGGSGNYAATPGDSAIADVTVAGNAVTVKGGATRGATTVLVADTVTGSTKSFSVTNGTPIGSISVAPSSVTVSKGTSTSVQVLGGSGTFAASPANSAIATATVAGSTVTITGGTASGSTSVLVIDAVTGSTATVSVTNGTPIGSISVAPSSVTVSNGTSTSVQVLGGSGTFTASPANSAIATATVAGSTVTITGGTASGSTSVQVIDAVTGSTATVSVTNGAVAGPLTVSPTVLFTTSDQAATAIVSGGSGQYGVSNVNTAFVKLASVAGNLLSVTGGADAGTVNVVVYDLVTPSSSVVVSVTNKGSSTLTATPASVTSLVKDTSAFVAIAGGSNSYGVSSADSTIATATISASVVTITGKKIGSTVVTVTDLSSGSTVNIGVTIVP